MPSLVTSAEALPQLPARSHIVAWSPEVALVRRVVPGLVIVAMPSADTVWS